MLVLGSYKQLDFFVLSVSNIVHISYERNEFRTNPTIARCVLKLAEIAYTQSFPSIRVKYSAVANKMQTDNFLLKSASPMLARRFYELPITC